MTHSFDSYLKIISKGTVVSGGMLTILIILGRFHWTEITIFVGIQIMIQRALGAIHEIHTKDGTTVTFPFVNQRL